MMQLQINSEPVDKIDVEELIKSFKVLNIDNFLAYLKEVWRDLAQRSDDKTKGINKITFSKYYELPGIISDRLFAVFDKNQNDYLDLNEFNEGMVTLFSESYESLSKFIFDFYDFDKDGNISREDIRVVLSYIPLNTKKFKRADSKYEIEEYRDRIESQDELHNMLEKFFKNYSRLDIKQFNTMLQNVSSDIFLFILIFLLDKRPFSKKTLEEFQGIKTKSSTLGSHLKSPNPSTKILLASPSLQSKFTPSITISKSPLMNKRTNLDVSYQPTAFESKKLGGKGEEAKSLLLKLAGKPVVAPSNHDNTGTDETTDENVMIKNLPKVNRKHRNNLKALEDTKENEKKIFNNYNDLPIMPAIKYQGEELKTKSELGIGIKVTSTNDSASDSDDDDNDNSNLKFEGYLYKITQSKKLKKLWFKLIFKDLYYYKNKQETVHKGMHNLSGVFVKEDQPISYENKKLYCFSVIYPKKVRFYYVDNEDEYKDWVRYIRKTTGYSNLTDIYDVKEKLGNGKFGLVRLGIHKVTGRKVAVKIMNKKDMTTQDLELVKTEIEILKICQQPNIIRLYDVFENTDYIYISKINFLSDKLLVMEFCSGGDLFSYVEQRGFRLPEPRAAEIIHKLCAACFYLHSYGIAHRDLKPENILMTEGSDSADIRLLDFGLSKIIGPNEFCNEPFGTLSYVAPEVLLEKPYNKSVDLWSIGIITYLLLCGCLPFDDEHSEREIARQTISDSVPYPSTIWKKISAEAKAFVDNLLQKDPSKRMTIKEVLEHPWIQKYNKSKLPEMRRKSHDASSSVFKIYTSASDEPNTSNK